MAKMRCLPCSHPPIVPHTSGLYSRWMPIVQTCSVEGNSGDMSSVWSYGPTASGAFCSLLWQRSPEAAAELLRPGAHIYTELFSALSSLIFYYLWDDFDSWSSCWMIEPKFWHYFGLRFIWILSLYMSFYIFLIYFCLYLVLFIFNCFYWSIVGIQYYVRFRWTA